jgi:uncharacterized protein (DUF1684 family)
MSAKGSVVPGETSVIRREWCTVCTLYWDITSPGLGLMTPRSVVCAFAMVVSAAMTATGAAPSRNPGRLLGVFDDARGQPVAGAQVVDLATNTRAVTPASGAISFAWPGACTTVLAIRKIGSAALMVPATVSAADREAARSSRSADA